MSTAKGPSAGYIYQFEVALWQLSCLDDNQSISIESIDDVAKIDKAGTYICSIQSKHSITISGKSFGNTSEDLWKTLNIWIDNIKNGKLDSNNKFIAISNKGVPRNSFLLNIGKCSFEDFIKTIEALKNEQEQKLSEKLLKGEKGNSLKKTILKIDNVLKNKPELEIIFKNFELSENQDDVKKHIYNHLNLGGFTEEQKNNFYQSLLGWIQDKCKDYWTDGMEATFSKSDFDLKWNMLRDTNPLKSLFFRRKEEFTDANLVNPESVNKNRLFIKQIEDIDRYDKEDIIEDAIVDFLCRDIEMNYLLKSSSLLTKEDFLKFEEKCLKKWREIVRNKITKPNINSYTEEELIEKAIEIYDEIMINLNLDFQDNFGFRDSNRYIQNGTFLSLSDKPNIGWHPDWKNKYTK